MKIETKYNIGDEVWVCGITNGTYFGVFGIVDELRLYVSKKDTTTNIIRVDYLVWVTPRHKHWFDEQSLFPTKEELLKSL